jgi:ribonucleotide reductase alpha subunit
MAKKLPQLDLTPIAAQILAERYLLRDEVGSILWTTDRQK